jgi:hypothetical protein
MIGQSVFLVASDMSREVDSLTKVLVARITGGAVVLSGAFCYKELGAAMPLPRVCLRPTAPNTARTLRRMFTDSCAGLC